MRYDYQCGKCKHSFELTMLIEDRDVPETKPCPKCKERGSVVRIFQALSISYDIHGPLKRAGSGWNDVLKKIAKPCGKYSTVEHN